MLPLVLIALYSLTAHLAISFDRPDIPLAALSAAAAIICVRAMRKHQGWLLPALATAAGCLLLWLGPGASLAVLSATPVVTNLLLLWVFAQSLRPGEVALITRIAASMEGELSPVLEDYTRAVTKAWCLIFGLMATIAALLAVLAPAVIWSAFANGINYALIGVFFVAEYVVRKWALPAQHHPGLIRFLRDLGRADIRSVVRKAPP
jgi:uncharacterized membrane protein